MFVTEAHSEDKTLTNHCICSTCITVFDRKGFEARHIISVSGHKREESIKSYASTVCCTKKRQMSNALASEIAEPKKQKIAINLKTDGLDKGNKQPVFELSFKDLLELSPEEKDFLVKELFKDQTLENEVANLTSSQLNVTSNVQNVSSMQPNSTKISVSKQ